MKRHAFSLVELSIVLVILGLLVGGILAGKALIRASELRKVTSDFTRYATAIYSFRDKYQGLPGDIINSATIWPSMGVTNGNGDGVIFGYARGVDAWRELSLAQLVEGDYDGVWDASGYTPPGTNAPKASIGNAVFVINGDIVNNGTWAVYQRMDNHLTMAAGINGNGYFADSYAINTDEALHIDTKMDDGKAQYGKLLGSGTAACVNNGMGNAPNPAVDYANLSSGAITCVLHYFF
jgi:prepilin-type N-terminal cleavage/methylation domain-containing protein